MAILAWAKAEGVFIKVQEGIGDNLMREDRAEGYVDYVLWSTFRPEYLDIDQELEMECLDSGMVLSNFVFFLLIEAMFPFQFGIICGHEACKTV